MSAQNAVLDFMLGPTGAWAGMTGTVLDYAGSAPPNADWLMCYGQAVKRSDYPNLFARIGTTYGAGDGTTTFNVPDARGRVAAGKDDMGGAASGNLGIATTGNTTAGSAVVTGIPSIVGISVGMMAIGPALPAGVTIATIDSGSQVTLSTGVGVTASTAGQIRFCVVDGQKLGATGGTHTQTLVASQMPAHAHPVILADPGHTHTSNAAINGGGSSTGGGGFGLNAPGAATIGGAGTGMYIHNGSGTNNITAMAGASTAHPNVQPTLVLNKIIKT